jgi:cytochrome P450
VWIVTDDALARAVLADPRVVKDPAWAPEGWDPRVAGLDPPAVTVPSLTTCEGPAHTRLRQAHAPLFGARRLREHYGRMIEVARELLTAAADGCCTEKPPPDGGGFSDMLGGTVDLTVGFTPRYPLVVLLDLLGVPLDRVDQAVAARRGMFAGPEAAGRAMGAFDEIAAAAPADGRGGLAVELRDRLPADLTAEQVRYLLFGLIFPGQLTTDPALGFVPADLLTSDDSGDPDEPSATRCDGTRPRRTRCGGSPPARSRSPASRCPPARRS